MLLVYFPCNILLLGLYKLVVLEVYFTKSHHINILFVVIACCSLVDLILQHV